MRLLSVLTAKCKLASSRGFASAALRLWVGVGTAHNALMAVAAAGNKVSHWSSNTHTCAHCCAVHLKVAAQPVRPEPPAARVACAGLLSSTDS